jgi:hypothetical protein
MPFYHRVYTPGQLQFITSTYRRTQLFLADRFRRCFVQRLEEVQLQHNNPVTRKRNCGIA